MKLLVLLKIVFGLTEEKRCLNCRTIARQQTMIRVAGYGWYCDEDCMNEFHAQKQW
jgi:hypothetical protein